MSNQREAGRDATDWLVGGGEMGNAVRSFDWSNTPLGPLASWPLGLRVAVGLCLNSRFPMHVWWGSSLTNIYNDAHVPILGERHPGALGRSAADVWSEVWPVLGPQVEAVMARGESTWNERAGVVLERNGYPEEAWFTWSYSPIRDEAGRVGGLLCVSTEDTGRVTAERERDRLEEERRRRLTDERVRAEEALRDSTLLLRGISDATGDVIYAKDREGRMLFANPATLALLGKPMEQVLGKTDAELLEDKAAAREVMENDRRVMEGGVPADVEEVVPLPDGTRRVWLSWKMPSRDAGGNVAGLLGVSRDITRRKQAEEALRESEAQFRLIADAMPQIVWVTRPDGYHEYYNRRWYEFLGLDYERTKGHQWADRLHPDDRERARGRWRQSLDTGAEYEIEYRFRRHDGEYRWFLGRALPVRDAAGRVVKWYGTCTDVHDQKHFLTQREQLLESERSARAEAERASQMKDEFLATLSHELRTPLNAILGWSQVLAGRGRNEVDLAEGLAVIERNARAQTQIIEDLLDMSRIINGKLRLDVQQIELARRLKRRPRPLHPQRMPRGFESSCCWIHLLAWYRETQTVFNRSFGTF